jgi:hypothetical protein
VGTKPAAKHAGAAATSAAKQKKPTADAGR